MSIYMSMYRNVPHALLYKALAAVGFTESSIGKIAVEKAHNSPNSLLLAVPKAVSVFHK